MTNTLIEINTPEELVNIAREINGGLDTSSITYSLKNDISLSGISWMPITRFRGIFEGNKHCITDLRIISDTDNELAFFHTIEQSASVKGLGLINCTVHGGNLISGLAAYSSGTITDCCVSGEFIASGQAASAVVGRVNHGILQRCYAMGTLHSARGAGGICTFLGNTNSTAQLMDCKFAGSINSSQDSDLICGICYEGSSVHSCTSLFSD